MRRALAILLVVGALVALALVLTSGSSGAAYEVRGYFDNGGFIVKGEQVRVAGANVGTVVSTDVSMPGEPVHASGRADPGKAIVVMKISDPGFEDFRTDASCIIRPQSLLGEKYIDCSPTQPRAPGSTAPPPLKVIAKGNPGAGQRFLPLESNGKQVDLDLVQNTFRLPYAERFRLILNDLGAGLAARGKDLAAIVRRADPALRETDQVLAILAQQNHALAKLATDSNAVLAPLARERTHVTGFIRGAGTTAAATAERGAQLQAGLHKFPRFLTQLRSTMAALQSFSNQAQPVFASLGAAAPSLTSFTKRLGPFSAAGETAFKSLGNAAAQSTAPLVASDSVVKDLRDLSRKAASPSRNLNKLLGSLNKTNGFRRLLDFIYYSSGSVNGFDQYGHFLRSELVSSNCVDYDIALFSGCGANFTFGGKAKSKSITGQAKRAPHRTAAGHRHAGSRAGQRLKSRLSGARRLLQFLIGPGAGAGAQAPSGSSSAAGAPGASAPGASPAPPAGTGTTTAPAPGGPGK